MYNGAAADADDTGSESRSDKLPADTAGRQEESRGGEDAIFVAEESLHRCVVSHGPSSPETRAVATDLVLEYNHLAMMMLSENDIKVGGAREKGKHE